MTVYYIVQITALFMSQSCWWLQDLGLLVDAVL